MEDPRCSDLPPILYYEQRPLGFERRLEQIDSTEFRRLFRCRICAQLWRIDDWDKYQAQFAVKLAERTGWRKYDETEVAKELLLRTRGGTGTEECAWAKCPNRAVTGMAICVDHLWKSGVRQ